MAIGQSNSKGNGAAKRMANPRRQEARSRSWANGQKRKARRRELEEAQHQANLAAGLTAWEAAQQRRRDRRADGFEKRHQAFHQRTNLPVPSDGCTVCVKAQREGEAA